MRPGGGGATASDYCLLYSTMLDPIECASLHQVLVNGRWCDGDTVT